MEASPPASVPPRVWSSLRERVEMSDADIELILFRAGNEVFAIPLEAVDLVVDSAELLTLPSMSAGVLGMLRLGDRTHPVSDPVDYLGVAVTSERPSVLVLEHSGRSGILVADAALDSLVVHCGNIRRVPALEDDAGVFVGVFFHGSQLVSLLDPQPFLRAGLRKYGAEGEASAAAPQPEHNPG